jgi:hypothetical protein
LSTVKRPHGLKKRVLILTADAGFGHRSAANAVRDAILDKYAEHMTVELLNPLDEPTTPSFLRDTQSDYDKYVKHVPELYQLGYEASDNLIPTAFLESSIGVLLVDTMREILTKNKPDVVVSTYPGIRQRYPRYSPAVKTRYPNSPW